MNLHTRARQQPRSHSSSHPKQLIEQQLHHPVTKMRMRHVCLKVLNAVVP